MGMSFQEVSRLHFPNQVAGLMNDVSVLPQSADAATIKVTNGTPNASITIQVLETTVDMQNGSGSKVTAGPFTVLGPYPPVFDANGAATIQIGGAVHISSNSTSGSYSGQATLRVTYN